MRGSTLSAGTVPTDTWQWGAALLMRQGMAAWVKNQRPVTSPERSAAHRRAPSLPLAADSSELIGVLTAVILNNYRERHNA